MLSTEKSLNIKQEKDLWSYLKAQQKPIVMYGMGNGADKIIAVCDEYGIKISDFFASDGFVRGHMFHGKPVLSYSDVRDKYGDDNFIVLLSFATSLDTVLDNIKRIASEAELYAPDVPVSGGGLFNLDYYKKNQDKFSLVYSMLEDDISKAIYKNTILYKLTGDIKYLFSAESEKSEVFSSLLSPERYETYADLGAYNGDTIRELLEYSASLSNVIAFEPDRRNYKKLEIYAENESRCKVNAFNLAAWDRKETLLFDDSGNRNANVGNSQSKKVKEVHSDTLDNIVKQCCLSRVDYIKYDVEGSEREAIIGSKGTIHRFTPDLLVSLYHRNEDMFSLPLLIKEIMPEYKLYIRRFRYVPAWDLNLYCINK